jgi:hypothetical protein
MFTGSQVAVQIKGDQIPLLQFFMFSIEIVPVFSLKRAQKEEKHLVLKNTRRRVEFSIS